MPNRSSVRSASLLYPKLSRHFARIRNRMHLMRTRTRLICRQLNLPATYKRLVQEKDVLVPQAQWDELFERAFVALESCPDDFYGPF